MENLKKSSTKCTGNRGEDKAADFLLRTGYKIVSRNFRTRDGEIDIIAEIDDVLCFVEVKTFPNGSLDLLRNVLGKRKRKRIIKTAKSFLSGHREYINNYIRFDVIVNDMPGLPSVYHIENAFAELL